MGCRCCALSELCGALEIAGFAPRAGAIFVWEGVIGYVTDDAIDQSLRFMATAGGPRSRLAFTFADDAHVGPQAMAKVPPGRGTPDSMVMKVALPTV